MDETPSKSLTGEIHILDIDGFGFMLRVFKRWDDYEARFHNNAGVWECGPTAEAAVRRMEQTIRSNVEYYTKLYQNS